uniref:Uncharacterized protein n=1 Tax=Oryza glumipatula TaxID=40148 RepID=A0A0E0B9E2_9ORYZ
MWCAFPASIDGDLSAMVLAAMVVKLLITKGTVVGGEVLDEAGLRKPSLFANAAPAGKRSAWVQPIMLGLAWTSSLTSLVINMKEPKVMRVVEGNVVVVMKLYKRLGHVAPRFEPQQDSRLEKRPRIRTPPAAIR